MSLGIHACVLDSRAVVIAGISIELRDWKKFADMPMLSSCIALAISGCIARLLLGAGSCASHKSLYARTQCPSSWRWRHEYLQASGSIRLRLGLESIYHFVYDFSDVVLLPSNTDFEPHATEKNVYANL